MILLEIPSNPNHAMFLQVHDSLFYECRVFKILSRSDTAFFEACENDGTHLRQLFALCIMGANY